MKTDIRHRIYIHNTNCSLVSTINTYIQFVDDYFHECELMKRDPVLTDLRAKFNYAFKQTNEQRSSEFFLLFNEYIQEQAGVKGWGKDMVDVYTRLRDKLQKFNPNLTFLTLNTKNLYRHCAQ